MRRGLGGVVGDQRELVWRPARVLAPASAAHWRDDILWLGDERLGQLRWLEETGLVAVAEVAGEHWVFRRGGFWHPRVVAERPPAEAAEGVFEPGVAGNGTLFVATGHGYHWRGASYWEAQWHWTSLDDLALVHFAIQPMVPASHGRITLTPQVIVQPELGLLTALGWYLLTLHAADESARPWHDEALGDGSR